MSVPSHVYPHHFPLPRPSSLSIFSMKISPTTVIHNNSMLIETTIFIVSTSWLPCNYLLFCFFKTRIKDFLFLSVTVILDTQYLFNKALSGWLRPPYWLFCSGRYHRSNYYSSRDLLHFPESSNDMTSINFLSANRKIIKCCNKLTTDLKTQKTEGSLWHRTGHF